MHVNEESNDGQQVQNCEDNQGIVEKGRLAITNGLDQPGVATYLNYEVQEKLILPFKFLNINTKYMK